jgi:shikimate kinase
MGSGKSSFGKKLALKLKLEFIDLDYYIEQESKQSITDIFNTKGENYFREFEHEALKNLLKKNNLVVSTGGGTACFKNNMELMKTGTTIYLQGSVDLLLSRLKQSKKERPLLKGKNEEELKNFIQESLKQREEFYLKANYIIDAKNANADQLATILQHK